MRTAAVIAIAAPKGKGAAAWEDGELLGDPAIIEAAKTVTHVIPHPEWGETPVDWTKAEHAVDALRQGATLAYGGRVHAFVSADKGSKVVASQTGGGDEE